MKLAITPFKTLEIVNHLGVYYLYINDKFYCTCDTFKEVTEEVQDLQSKGAEVKLFIESLGVLLVFTVVFFCFWSIL